MLIFNALLNAVPVHLAAIARAQEEPLQDQLDHLLSKWLLMPSLSKLLKIES